MDTTVHGFPFVEDTDDVKDYPVTSLALANAIEAAIQRRYAKAKVVAAQNVAALTGGVGAAIAFDGEDADTDGFHDVAVNNSRLTIPAGLGGLYLILASLLAANTGSAAREWVYIRKNGAGVLSGGGNTNNGTLAANGILSEATAIDVAAAGDYYEAMALNDSGAARSITQATFTIVRLAL